MPQQHLQQPATTPSRTTTSFAATPSASVAGNGATMKKASLTDKEYAAWYRMKRAGFWRWAMIENVREELWSAVSSSVFQTCIWSSLFVKETPSLYEKMSLIALIFTLTFEANLILGGAGKWTSVMRYAARYHKDLTR